MRRIYHFSSVVLLWLGPAADNSDVAMQSIQDYNKGYWQGYDFQVQFMDILYRPWFTRTWVVQEFVLGKNHPLVGCGTVWVHWISFMAAWAHFGDGMKLVAQEYEAQYSVALAETFQTAWIQRISRETTGSESVSKEDILRGLAVASGENCLKYTGHPTVIELLDDIQADPSIWSERLTVMKRCRYETPGAKVYWKRLELSRITPDSYCGFLLDARGVVLLRKQPLSLATSPKSTMYLRSTDPRDKIYGILGLVSEKAREKIAVDYRQTFELTFVHAMAYILQDEPGGLELVGLLWSRRPFQIRCPSWVPNFTVAVDMTDAHSPAFLRGSCWDAPWKFPIDAKVSDDLTTMSASGFSFGKVKELIHITEREGQAFTKQLLDIESLVTRECPLNEPLWRTLIVFRNTDRAALAVGMPFDQRFEILTGRSRYEDYSGMSFGSVGELREFIVSSIGDKIFFVTDAGFAGVSTPEVETGDTVGLIFGTKHPAVLREATPEELGVQIKSSVEGVRLHRIVGFAYVGCHSREEFETLDKEGLQDWRKHACFRQREPVRFHII